MNTMKDAIPLILVSILWWFIGVASVETMIIYKLDNKEPMKLMYYSDKVRINKE